MSELTLREVCEKLGVSRRAVQGYEKAGLVTASGKTDRGYLLYDAQAQKRIRQIKQYQKFGFQLREIAKIIDAPESVLKQALIKQAKVLKKKKVQTEDSLDEIYELIGAM